MRPPRLQNLFFGNYESKTFDSSSDENDAKKKLLENASKLEEFRGVFTGDNGKEVPELYPRRGRFFRFLFSSMRCLKKRICNG